MDMNRLLRRFSAMLLSLTFALVLAVNLAPAFVSTAQADATTQAQPVPLTDFTGTSDTNTTDAIGNVQARLAFLVRTMFIVLATLSLLPIVFGGLRLVTSQGNSESVEKGKTTLFWGVVGLILSLSAIGIFQILLNLIYTKPA